MPGAAGDPLAVASRVAARLGEIDGVVAVVLGGSRASGSADEFSDIDLGLYYRSSRAPSVAAIDALARELDDRHETGLVTALGEWGPWVNGGSWLRIEGWRVDLLYRDIERVADVIEDCRDGRVTCDYYLGHPHGFHNHIYLAEVSACRPLFDPNHALAALKILVSRYPPAMKEALIEKYLFDARFMLDLARAPATRGDVFEVAGCLFRVVAALVQVLFAINERYFLNEKGALGSIAGFPRAPRQFVRQAVSLLARPGETPRRLELSVRTAGQLVEAVRTTAAAEGLPGGQPPQ